MDHRVWGTLNEETGEHSRESAWDRMSRWKTTWYGEGPAEGPTCDLGTGTEPALMVCSVMT